MSCIRKYFTKEDYLKMDRDRKRQDYNDQPEKYRCKNIRSRHGITFEEYDALLTSQGGGCELCGTDTPGGVGRFHIDHNHKTGKIRGVLCHHCNVGLGMLKDDPMLLRAAALYVEKG